jgi:nicotinamidase-related amidase
MNTPPQGQSALLLIDIQQAMFGPDEICHEPNALVQKLGDLLARARSAGVPVFHVRHCEAEGPFEPGSDGWHIHASVAPSEGEPVFEKWASSAFYNTDLDARLRERGIEELTIAGLQSEYCIDTACRVAQSLGYRVTLVADGHSTFDTAELSAAQIIAHHNKVLSGIVARVTPAKDVRFG